MIIIMKNYLPEGKLINTNTNKSYLKSLSALNEAKDLGIILEAKALMCDCEHNIIVDIPGTKAIIPRIEGAIGIDSGETKDIALLSRVNKPVCFKVTDIVKDENEETIVILSRRSAQKECVENHINLLKSGDVISAKITHIEQFGCFVDIGCGISSLIPIDAISVSRISHPSDRFYNGQDIYAVVKGREGDRIFLTHKELLGTWSENADLFEVGQTVGGIIRSIEDYGIFIELTPNLAGLAEPKDNVHIGQSASVFIKSIIPEKMKVKLIIVDVFSDNEFDKSINYYITDGHIDKWNYSTKNCHKQIYTEF